MTPNEYHALKKTVDETHDAVIKLQTHWNGGPGTWPICIAHTASTDDHEKRLRLTEYRIYGAMGVLALVGLAIEIYSKLH